MNDTVLPMRSMPLPRLHPAAPWLLLLLTPNIGFFVTNVYVGHLSMTDALRLFAPSMVVLAVVAFVHLRTTAMTVRLRSELRLQLIAGLPLLIVSGVFLWVDALDGVNLSSFTRTAAMMSCWPLGVATLIWPLTSAVEQGTLEQYATSPLGRRALIEKYLLAAFLFLVSYVQLFGAAMHSMAPPFKMQIFALVSAPAIALLFRRAVPALGVTMIAPLVCIGAAIAAFGEPGAAVMAVLYIGGSIVAVPVLWKRGLLAQNVDDASPRTFTLWRGIPIGLAIELRAQRDTVILGVVSLLCAGIVARFYGYTGASMAMYLFSALAAATAPALAFTEARVSGTLDTELTSRSRRAVFIRKSLLSLGVVLVISAGLPIAMQFALGNLTSAMATGWTVGMVGLWAVSLFWAVQLRTTGTAVAAAIVSSIAVTLIASTMFGVSTMWEFALREIIVEALPGLTAVRWMPNFEHSFAATLALFPLLCLGIGSATFVIPGVRALRVALIGLGFWLFSAAAFVFATMINHVA